jgi:hypothetical protein
MRYFILLFSFVLVSCSTQKINTLIPPCPEDVECPSEIHEGHRLVVKKDDTGQLYYNLEEDKDKTVFIYHYKQNMDESYIDGHYNEEIVFELDNSMLKNSFKDIKPTQSLFGVFCYCKGKAGYYPIENSRVSYDVKTKNLIFVLEQVVENQVVSIFEIKIEN